jgi:hypothetical protein
VSSSFSASSASRFCSGGGGGGCWTCPLLCPRIVPRSNNNNKDNNKNRWLINFLLKLTFESFSFPGYFCLENKHQRDHVQRHGKRKQDAHSGKKIKIKINISATPLKRRGKCTNAGSICSRRFE